MKPRASAGRARSLAFSIYAFLRNSQGRVLVLRPSSGSKSAPGPWEFPGGPLKSGKALDETLARMVADQTGLSVRLEGVADAHSAPGENGHAAVLILEGRCDDAPPVLRLKRREAEWVTMDRLVSLDFAPSIAPLAIRYARHHGYGPTPSASKEAPYAIDTDWLAKQAGAFRDLQPKYELLASTLASILRKAARELCPLAFVTSRVKSPSSFAEKITRKSKYRDPLQEMTDLAGVRVITQTKSEAEAMSRFVRENFEIDERNSLDALSRLKSTEFGYRSTHFIVRLRLGTVPDLPADILNLKAEVQVRTILQHAWSDIGHDRLYKGGFQVPAKWEREAARIAAVLESADDAFSRLVEGLERYHCHFGAYLTPEEIAVEIERVQAARLHDPKNPDLVQRQARLAIARDEWKRALDFIDAFKEPLTAGLLTCRGIALCHLHHSDPFGKRYAEGRECFQLAIAKDPTQVEPRVRLAETETDSQKKLRLFQEAFQTDPSDPAALSGYVRQRIAVERDSGFVPLLRPNLEEAIAKCEDQVAVGVNIPWAIYRSAGFRLLLGCDHEWQCLATLARAVQRPQARSFLDSALETATLLESVDPHRHDVHCVQRFLCAARGARFPDESTATELKRLATPYKPPIQGPVVIVAGGCDPAHAEALGRYRELLRRALADFKGTIISGGTREGVCGLVGELGESCAGRIHTIGYLPRSLPADGTATRDERYHELRNTTHRDHFSPLEPIQNWIDLLASGIQPKDVRVLGINGGPIAALEYRMAWALGARVAVVRASGREADRLEQEIQSNEFEGVIVVPEDPTSIRAFVHGGSTDTGGLGQEDREHLARYVHARFLDENRHKNPDRAMRPWEHLDPDLRQSNLDQIQYMGSILRAVGFDVLPASGPIECPQIADELLEKMAEMEHGRWVIERLQSGWHYAERRDPARRLSPYLVGWDDPRLGDPVKQWDRSNVRRFPKLLADAGYQVVARIAGTPSKVSHRDRRNASVRKGNK